MQKSIQNRRHNAQRQALRRVVTYTNMLPTHTAIHWDIHEALRKAKHEVYILTERIANFAPPKNSTSPSRQAALCRNR